MRPAHARPLPSSTHLGGGAGAQALAAALQVHGPVAHLLRLLGQPA